MRPEQRRIVLLGGIGVSVVVLVLGAAAIGIFTTNHAAPSLDYQNKPVAFAVTPTAQSTRKDAPASLGSLDNNDALAVAPPSNTGGEPSQPLQNRIVLKNATMSITVTDPASTIGSIGKIAEDLGGWVVTSNSYQQANASGIKLTYGSITIRVPAAKLNQVLGQINSAAVSVDSVNITGDDVTEQYTDLSSQLTNLQTAETDLRKIMDSATKTQDVLAVFQQLTGIRGQIEQIQGKLKFYDQSAAFSSIAVNLSPRQDDKPLDIAGWQPTTTLKAALESLVHILQGLVDLLIWLAIVVLPFVVLLYLAYRLIRRFRPNKARAIATIEAHQE